MFLAVMSAVFVLEPNRDATLKSAGERLAGAVIGTIVGLAAMALARTGALPWPLALAMLVMGGIAAWKPRLRYGIVAAAGLSIGSESGFLVTAQERGAAIFLGALIGIAVGWFLLPESAAARARRQLSDALAACRGLLDSALADALEDRDDQLSEGHAEFRRSIVAAGETAQGLRFRKSPLARPLEDAVHGAERLWHALIILDRVTEIRSGHGLKLAPGVQELLKSIRSDACSALERLCAFEQLDQECLDSLAESCRQAREATEVSTSDRVEGVALAFGLSEVARNIREIDRSIALLHGGKEGR